MERKFQIPKMTDEELLKWSTVIKPIFFVSYLRELTLDEIKYHTINNFSNLGVTVDYNALSALADIKMLHTMAYDGRFYPTAQDVLAQIPKELIEKVTAFEIIAGPIEKSGLYKDYLAQGYHVSVVRLYEAKSETNIAAYPINYPSANCKCPIGMSEKEFTAIKEWF